MTASATTPRQDRAYQNRVHLEAKRAYAAGKRGILVVAPCGAGKTWIASRKVAGAVAKGQRVAWFAHRQELVQQAADTLRSAGVRVGVGGAADRSAPCQVVTVQTILARGEAPPADVVVLDECHHFASAAETWADIWRTYRARGALILGYTATPARADGCGLGAPSGPFDHMIVAATVAELTELGHLVPCRVLAAAHGLADKSIAQSPCDAYRKHAPTGRAIVFVANMVAGQETTDEFARAGIPARFVHGKLSDDARAQALAEFAAGRVSVLVNIFVLTEGFDSTQADTCILARQMGSHAMYIQSAGRVLRTHPGKTHALLIDLAGNVDAHGAIDSPYEYHLHGEGIRRAGETADVCRSCGGPKSPGEPCERCGAGVTADMEAPAVAGVELVSWQERKRMEPPKRRVQSLAKWMREAAAKGYKRGAVNYKYRAVFGNFPPRWATEQAKAWNAQQAKSTEDAMARFEAEATP